MKKGTYLIQAIPPPCPPIIQRPSPTSIWDSSEKLLCILQKINLRRNHEKYHSNSFQIQSTDNFFYLSKIKINDHSLDRKRARGSYWHTPKSRAGFFSVASFAIVFNFQFSNSKQIILSKTNAKNHNTTFVIKFFWNICLKIF